MLQNPRHAAAGEHEHARDQQRRLREHERDLARRPALPGEDRDGEHHRDDGEVLEHENRDREPPRGRVGLGALGEQPEHDRRTAQRHEKAGVHARREPDAERGEPARDDGDREADLHAAADEDCALEPRQVAETELDADREQQQDHADLGEHVHERLVRDDAERVRADRDAGEQEPGDRHEPQPERHERDDDARDKERDEFVQERQRNGRHRETEVRAGPT